MEPYDFHKVAERLAELLLVQRSDVQLDMAPMAATIERGFDFVLKGAGYTFICAMKRTTSSATLQQSAQRLHHEAKTRDENTIPLLVVPYMGETGSRICDEWNVSWLDLSGNARIVGPGLNISWMGRPNRFKAELDTKGIFAPKIARLVRWFLMHPEMTTSQRELTHDTDLDKGYVSHAIARMLEAGYISRDGKKRLRARNARLLLEDWRHAYDFSKHQVLRGHILARSGEELTRKVAEVLEREARKYAFTGLSAAWLMDHFAGYRLGTVYLERPPDEALLSAMGFRDEPRGANTWLIVPKDEGIFQGSAPRDGICCVHPVQAYVDLKALPERASEAAEHLLAQIIEDFAHA